MDGIELLTCMHDSHVTRLIAENTHKRELGLLPDEWFPLDGIVCKNHRMDLLPTDEQQKELVIPLMESLICTFEENLEEADKQLEENKYDLWTKLINTPYAVYSKAPFLKEKTNLNIKLKLDRRVVKQRYWLSRTPEDN